MLRQLQTNLRSQDWIRDCLLAGRAGGSVRLPPPGSRVLVEFSSPNVAKPFHVGHLRSTLVGKWVASVLKTSGYSVERVNWLGDWGTQFGVLALGLRRFGSLESLDSVDGLYDVYVRASAAAAADAAFALDARRLFASMEAGDPEALTLRTRVAAASRADFERLYERLGVAFERWDAESEYAGKAAGVVQRLGAAGRLVEEGGALGVRDDGGSLLLLQKADGASLYLSRDVAAVLHRIQRTDPKHIFYVVDQSQSPHFQRIKKVLEIMGEEDAASRITHIPFGRIAGMSSRKGNAVFIAELLTKGHEAARALITSSATCQVPTDELDSASEDLALSSLSMAELGRWRRSEVTFSWEAALRMRQAGGGMLRTGALLQYRHARLCTLTRDWTPGLRGWEGPDPTEPEAAALMATMGGLPAALGAALGALESRPLADFAFRLLADLGTATKRLKLRDPSRTPEETAQRLLLFETAKETLATTMRLLNIRPMERI